MKPFQASCAKGLAVKKKLTSNGLGTDSGLGFGSGIGSGSGRASGMGSGSGRGSGLERVVGSMEQPRRRRTKTGNILNLNK